MSKVNFFPAFPASGQRKVSVFPAFPTHFPKSAFFPVFPAPVDTLWLSHKYEIKQEKEKSRVGRILERKDFLLHVHLSLALGG